MADTAAHLVEHARPPRAPRPGGGLTPGLAEVIKRTFRSMHFLAWLRREELAAVGRESDLDAAAESARRALAEMLGETDADAER